MGVSGSGKSTIGAMLAEQLKLPFYDGDDFHPQENIDKMSRGAALNDTDRQPWLEKLARLPLENPEGCITACSALKKSYRETLNSHVLQRFIYLKGNQEDLQPRLIKRSAENLHFMPSSLLESQFETLEAPDRSSLFMSLEIQLSPEQLVSQIAHTIRNEHC